MNSEKVIPFFVGWIVGGVLTLIVLPHVEVTPKDVMRHVLKRGIIVTSCDDSGTHFGVHGVMWMGRVTSVDLGGPREVIVAVEDFETYPTFVPQEENR